MSIVYITILVIMIYLLIQVNKILFSIFLSLEEQHKNITTKDIGNKHEKH